MIKLGPKGSASFTNVPAQTMWLIAIVPYGNQHFVWNLRVDVRAGTNSITFDKATLQPFIDRTGFAQKVIT